VDLIILMFLNSQIQKSAGRLSRFGGSSSDAYLHHAVGLGLELSTEIYPAIFLREGVSFLEGRAELYYYFLCMYIRDDKRERGGGFALTLLRHAARTLTFTNTQCNTFKTKRLQLSKVGVWLQGAKEVR
jgi:hypothetical protein